LKLRYRELGKLKRQKSELCTRERKDRLEELKKKKRKKKDEERFHQFKT